MFVWLSNTMLFLFHGFRFFPSKHLVSDVLIKIEIQSLERPGSIILIQRARKRVVVLVLLSLITDAFRLKLKVIRLARYLV